MSGHTVERMLRWYPAGWRDRYGDELVALMEDDLGGAPPSARYRWSIATAGLRERALASGLLGRSAGADERMRTGVQLVLAGWAACIFAGAVFAKIAEHFAPALAAPHRAIPQDAFDAVQGAAALAAACTLLAIAVALRALVGFVRAGGWSTLRRPVLQAGAPSILVVVALARLAPWAHSLSNAARNGGDPAYGAAFVAWALLVAGALALWARAGAVAFRGLRPTGRTLGAIGALATIVAVAILAVTAAVALWWAQIALHAPWFLHGTPAGSAGSPWDPTLAGAACVMLLALGVAQHGVSRIVGARRELASHRD